MGSASSIPIGGVVDIQPVRGQDLLGQYIRIDQKWRIPIGAAIRHVGGFHQQIAEISRCTPTLH